MVVVCIAISRSPIWQKAHLSADLPVAREDDDGEDMDDVSNMVTRALEQQYLSQLPRYATVRQARKGLLRTEFAPMDESAGRTDSARTSSMGRHASKTGLGAGGGAAAPAAVIEAAGISASATGNVRV